VNPARAKVCAVILDDLLARRLIFVSGKGGVGKSSVAAALALAARRRGRRVLLAEIDAPRSLGRTLGGVSAGPEEAEVLPGLWLVNLNPSDVMDEYVRHVVKLDWVARRVLESPVYHRFVAFAPGLKELITLGKLMVLQEAHGQRGPGPRWDTIIVDAPATGHGLALLKVPMAASEAVPVGPVGHNARRVLALMRDVTRTTVVIVTVPEEMAVTEAEQFYRLAQDEVRMDVGAVVLNDCHEQLFTPRQEAEVLERLARGEDGPLDGRVRLGPALAAARRQLRREKLTRFYLQRLRRRLPAPLLALPHVFTDELDLADLRRLSDRLEAA